MMAVGGDAQRKLKNKRFFMITQKEFLIGVRINPHPFVRYQQRFGLTEFC